MKNLRGYLALFLSTTAILGLYINSGQAHRAVNKIDNEKSVGAEMPEKQAMSFFGTYVFGFKVSTNDRVVATNFGLRDHHEK